MNMIEVYQFPMGKVKLAFEIRKFCNISKLKSINSQWER